MWYGGTAVHSIALSLGVSEKEGNNASSLSVSFLLAVFLKLPPQQA
jgi:hypothetical protein